MKRRTRSVVLRRELQQAITRRIRELGVTQARAGVRLGVSQPRVNALVRGRIELFSLDALVDLAVRLGLKVGMRVAKRRGR